MALEGRGGNPHILKRTGDDVTLTVTKNGSPAIVTGTPRVTVTRADGTVLVNNAVAANTDGVLSYTLTPAQTADMDLLAASWTADVDGVTHTFTTEHEIVGSHLFTEAQFRAYDGARFADQTKYPDAAVLDARARVTDRMWDATGTSWTRRFRRSRLNGSGSGDLELPATIIETITAATVDGVALTGDQLADLIPYDDGTVTWDGGSWVTGKRNVVLEYEFGYSVPKYGADQIAMMWVAAELYSSKVGDRAVQFVDELGQTTRLWVPTADAPSGIPYVDAWLRAHKEPVVA